MTEVEKDEDGYEAVFKKFSKGDEEPKAGLVVDQNEADSNDMAAAFNEAEPMPEAAPPAPSPATGRLSFKERFAQARRDNEKVFEWNGKKYTSDLAKPGAKKNSPPVQSVVKRPPLTAMPEKDVKLAQAAMGGPATTMTPRNPKPVTAGGEEMFSAPDDMIVTPSRFK